MAFVRGVTALFTLSGKDAVRHVFRVASGLDSMVLGEPQILARRTIAAMAILNLLLS